MNNKVLLVYPGGFNSIFPELPMSILYLSWALKKSGFEVQVLDTRVDNYKEIKVNDYLFCGISTMTGSMIKNGLKVAKHLRSLDPRVPIVWGGIHVTLLPEQSLADTLVDIIVRGEGEATIQDLAVSLKDGRSLDHIPGISYKKDGKIIHNPDRKFIDLNEIDIKLPYDLFKIEKYAVQTFPVHTSRGCPFRCGFCYNTAFNKRSWRYKKSEKVLDEIEYVVKLTGAKRISFTWEDEFFISVERVREICAGLIERKIGVEWESFCRFDSFQKVDDNLLGLMEKSGCVTLSFGGESGSQRVLDEIINKDIKVEQIIEATKRLSKTSIKQVVSFISGLPGLSEDDMKLTFELMDRLVVINPKILLNGIFLYTPYPGTPLFNKIIKEYNYRIPDSLEKWGDFGIYRNVNNVWCDRKTAKKYKIISVLTRFPFWKKDFSFKDISMVMESSRFSRFPFNVVYYMFARMAIFRWDHKFFKFPVEWLLLEKLLEKMRGFV